MKVKLLINPSRLYSLAYDKDDVVDLPDTLAQVMIEDKHAEAVDEKGDDEAPEKPKAKTKGAKV